jgi:Gas vesicle synthesis protein GvpO
MMIEHPRERSGDDRDADQPSILAREAVQLAPEYIIEITGRRPVQITGLAPTDEDGWIVELEIVEDRRIPSSADMLALYQIELDADGILLAYRRTRRYMRGEVLDGEQTALDAEQIAPHTRTAQI